MIIFETYVSLDRVGLAIRANFLALPVQNGHHTPIPWFYAVFHGFTPFPTRPLIGSALSLFLAILRNHFRFADSTFVRRSRSLIGPKIARSKFSEISAM